MTRPVVIGGATGFVGRRLVRHLLAQGVPVRATSRDPERARRAMPEVTWVRLDVEDPRLVRAAFHGAQAYVHLVHHMQETMGDLVAREVRAACNVAQLAAEEGLDRVIYLGAPAGGTSHHLDARARTGETLRAGAVPCFELRAAMIVGAGSESWLIVRDLAMRLPVMVLPSWLRSRTQPIAVDDVVAALARCLTLPAAQAGAWDLPGPEILSARDILTRAAALRGMRPRMVPIPVLSPRLSGAWLRLVTRADWSIARRLVDGLTEDLLMDPVGLYAICPDLPRTPFEEAARRALAEEEAPGVGGRLWEAVARRVAGR
jgi:uncharacterized protein YbjT (DUF2867 family)